MMTAATTTHAVASDLLRSFWLALGGRADDTTRVHFVGAGV